MKKAIRQGAEARGKAANVTPKAAELGPLLTLDRIFKSDEFHEERQGQLTWSKLSGSYFTLEAPAAEPPAAKPDADDPAKKNANAKKSRADMRRTPVGVIAMRRE